MTAKGLVVILVLGVLGYAGYMHKAEVYTAMRPILVGMGAAAPTPNPARDSSMAAVRMYPDLARSGSAFNTMFLQLYADRKKSDPQSLTVPDWPVALASEVGNKLGIQPFTGPQAVLGADWQSPLDR